MSASVRTPNPLPGARNRHRLPRRSARPPPPALPEGDPLANETKTMAMFCDFENVALGVRDAKYAQFDIKKVLERLLLKGSIVVKKAYCD